MNAKLDEDATFDEDFNLNEEDANLDADLEANLMRMLIL